MPGLELKLRQAGMLESPEDFIKKTFFSAFYMTTAMMVFVWAIFAQVERITGFVLFIFPILFLLMFGYFLKFPDVRILKREREIAREIVFAGRFIVIEVESGVPLYDALAHVRENYPVIGQYFNEIINKVDIGTSLEDAINEAIEYSPSANLRRVLWQILNALRTGGDISRSLSAVLGQITREQLIEVKQYGKKLNPLAMFYLMIAVIIPTLGTTMLIIITNFFDFTVELSILLILAGFVAFLQFMFLTLIRSSRPAVQL